jgi:hypothetical protein
VAFIPGNTDGFHVVEAFEIHLVHLNDIDVLEAYFFDAFVDGGIEDSIAP